LQAELLMSRTAGLDEPDSACCTLSRPGMRIDATPTPRRDPSKTVAGHDNFKCQAKGHVSCPPSKVQVRAGIISFACQTSTRFVHGLGRRGLTGISMASLYCSVIVPPGSNNLLCLGRATVDHASVLGSCLDQPLFVDDGVGAQTRWLGTNPTCCHGRFPAPSPCYHGEQCSRLMFEPRLGTKSDNISTAESSHEMSPRRQRDCTSTTSSLPCWRWPHIGLFGRRQLRHLEPSFTLSTIDLGEGAAREVARALGFSLPLELSLDFGIYQFKPLDRCKRNRTGRAGSHAAGSQTLSSK